MLNLEIHKEEVQSSKFKVQSEYANLNSAVEMQRHPELDSGSYAARLETFEVSKTSKVWETQKTMSPQNKFAYETCLTKMNFGWGNKVSNWNSGVKPAISDQDPLNPPKGDNSSPSVDGRLGGVRITNTTSFSHSINNLIDPILIALRLPLTTQNERSNTDITSALTIVNSEIASGISENNGFNINKNRIDKQLKPNCRSTNKNKQVLIFLNEEIFARSTEIFPLREGEMSAGQRGFNCLSRIFIQN